MMGNGPSKKDDMREVVEQGHVGCKKDLEELNQWTKALELVCIAQHNANLALSEQVSQLKEHVSRIKTRCTAAEDAISVHIEESTLKQRFAAHIHEKKRAELIQEFVLKQRYTAQQHIKQMAGLASQKQGLELICAQQAQRIQVFQTLVAMLGASITDPHYQVCSEHLQYYHRLQQLAPPLPRLNYPKDVTRIFFHR